MEQDLYSIRMRASCNGQHVSGAEQIVPRNELDHVTTELRTRALGRTPEPDKIIITIESLAGLAIQAVPALPVTSFSSLDHTSARAEAVRMLERAGVASSVAHAACGLLDRGAASSGAIMRGAVLLTAGAGKRLEPDQERGIRVSRFDWDLGIREEAIRQLDEAGLGHFRTREALALASKVASAPGVIAELCWSDDPDYTAGYVASRTMGYLRFPVMKAAGQKTGGRIFFVRDKEIDLNRCIHYLEHEPVLISGITSIIRN